MRSQKQQKVVSSLPIDQTDQALKLHHEVTFNFLNTEMDLAETFCAIAQRADSDELRQRNLGHAQKAFDSASHFSERVTGTDEEIARIRAKLAKLKRILGDAALGTAKRKQSG